MRIAWKLLIAAGAILIVIALGYDTTIQTGLGRVHNIGLQNERQMLLILGCFLMLAGVILFAVAKLKQTPEEDRRDLEERKAAEAKAAQKLEQARANVAAASNVLSAMRPKWDKWGIRLVAGLLIGWYWMAMFVIGASSLGWGLIAFIAGLYACFMGRDMRGGLGIVLTLTSAFAAVSLLALLGGSEVPMAERIDTEFIVKAVVLFVLPGIGALATGLYLLTSSKPPVGPVPTK